jgi:hypothetical protein
VSRLMGWVTEESGFDSRKMHHMLLSNKASRLALVPTQSHLKRVAESLPGVKRPRREADLPPQSCAEIKNAWSHTSAHNIFSYSAFKL